MNLGDGDFEPWPSGVQVHLEWGPTGAALAAEQGDLIVIIDVLSFSTSITLTAHRAAVALAYSAEEIEGLGGRGAISERFDADIVAKTRLPPKGEFSLSPASLVDLPSGRRLIFTSLNGAACVAASVAAPEVLIGCLLNGGAAADLVASRLGQGLTDRCTLIACGERWSSTAKLNGWRPCIEDHLGAGAIAARLLAKGLSLSPEAALATSAYEAMKRSLPQVLSQSVSGRELVSKGFRTDVDLAANTNTVDVVPSWDTAHEVREFRPLNATDAPDHSFVADLANNTADI